MKHYERELRRHDRSFAREAADAFNAGHEVDKVLEHLDMTPQVRPNGQLQRRTPGRIKRYRPDPMSKIMQDARAKSIMGAAIAEVVGAETNQNVSEHVVFGTPQYEDYLKRNIFTSGAPVVDSE